MSIYQLGLGFLGESDYEVISDLLRTTFSTHPSLSKFIINCYSCCYKLSDSTFILNFCSFYSASFYFYIINPPKLT
jgi:hypothetical protein